MPPFGRAVGVGVTLRRMSDVTPYEKQPSLVALSFDHPLKAQEALLAAMRLQERGHLKLDDAAIVSKGAGGRIRIQQTKDINPGQGAVSGSWWGILAGIFAGQPLIGAALGAALGGLWAKLRDLGIDDDEMRRLGEKLPNEHAALFVLIVEASLPVVLAELRRFDGGLLFDQLDEDTRAKVIESMGAGVVRWDAI